MTKRRIGAPSGLRWGLFAVGAVAVLSTLTFDSADARGRRHHHRPRIARAGGYNPPYAAIVVDANTGKVLHAANADSIRHPASLTKVMTLYLLFEQLEAGKLRLDSELPVSAHAAAQAPSKLGVRPGQSIDVDDAIKSLVTKSANDVAVVIAEAIGGDEDDFAKMMTRKARALGMSRTFYANASGLPNDAQVTTARDQATLGRAIQDRFPKLYRYFATPNFTYHGRNIRNHNNLLGRVEGIDGIKTGYIRKSGFNLISSMRRGDRHLVAAVLGGSSGRWRDARMKSLLEQTWMLASTHRQSKAIEVAEAIDAPARSRAADVEEVEQAETQAPSEAPTRPEPIIKNPPRAVSAALRPSPGSVEPIRPIMVQTIPVKRTLQSGRGQPAAGATREATMALRQVGVSRQYADLQRTSDGDAQQRQWRLADPDRRASERGCGERSPEGRQESRQDHAGFGRAVYRAGRQGWQHAVSRALCRLRQGSRGSGMQVP